MDEQARLLTERDAAKFLGVNPVFLAGLRSRGEDPPYVRLWKRRGIRYRQADLDAFVASRVVRAKVSGGGDGDETAVLLPR